MGFEKKSNQNGRTIVELIAYIVVMVAITASVAQIVAQGLHKYESSAVLQQLLDLKKVIAARYAADGNYQNLSWNDLCADRIGPKSLMPETDASTGRCVSQHGRHIFDGIVRIGSADVGKTYYIEFQELPQDVCVQLGTIVWSNMDGSDLDRMVIGQGAGLQHSKTWVWQYSPVSEADGDKELPANIRDVADSCTSEDDNTIRWYFN
ncbi:MAG: hypothetical protein J5895_04890 [Alphaproteobacteria bacterium]|nr:hypothetical protein [Alphaproteobacteria bacterium]